MGELGLWLFPVAGFETLIVSVTNNGVVTAGISGDELDALLTLLIEPYRWTVPEGSGEEQPDEEAPLSLLYDPLLPINFADTLGTWSGFEVLLMWNPEVLSTSAS